MYKQSSKQRIVSNLVFLLDPLTITDIDRTAYDKGICEFVEANIRCCDPHYDEESVKRHVRYAFQSGKISDRSEKMSDRVRNDVTNPVFAVNAINKNVRDTIGKILGVSSENVRQTIARGDVVRVRSLLISASLLAEHFFGGEE
jgi:hypothetical protein